MSSTHLKSVPNILIYCDNAEKFTEMKSTLQTLIGTCSYTIYKISTSEMLKSSIWMNNCSLLISAEIWHGQNSGCLTKYLEDGGRILSIVTDGNLDEFPGSESNFEREIFIENESNEVIEHCPGLEGAHYISKASFKTSNNIYLELFNQILTLQDIESNSLAQFFEVYQTITQNSLLQSVDVVEDYLKERISKNSKFLSKNSPDSFNFNRKIYFENLKTSKLGSIVLHSKLSKSTMDTLETLPKSINNIVVLADQQTAGKGTHDNEWLSPPGCCMFTLFMNLSNDFSFSRLSLIQFAAGLACTQAIRSEANLQDLPLQVKWPNDIYFNKKVKLGGVLVKSSLMGTSAFLKIGIGFNINNEKPTECLNKILKEKGLEPWSSEKFIAKFLNHFERHISELTEPNGLNDFIQEFQDNWIHKNQMVRVEHWNEDVEIIGLNEYGYLKVKRNDGSVHLLQPDGNRYDMMRNLLVLRD